MSAFKGFTIGPVAYLGTQDYAAGGGCKLTVKLTDMEGRPIVGQVIIFYEPPNTPLESPTLEIETDSTGYAEIMLERGHVVEVAFLGTAFIRRIVVPDAPFADILQLANVPVFDAFSIVKLDPIPVIRRTC